jgi:hypothetical protein
MTVTMNCTDRSYTERIRDTVAAIQIARKVDQFTSQALYDAGGKLPRNKSHPLRRERFTAGFLLAAVPLPSRLEDRRRSMRPSSSQEMHLWNLSN